MRARYSLFLSCLFILGAAGLAAKDFWDEPFETWNRNQVAKMLSDSPWAKDQTFTFAVDSKDAGIHGEKETFQKFTVRFFSARPVREAYVRMLQIMNNYDRMGPDERKEFEARFNRALKIDVSNRVIIAVEFASNIPDTHRDMKQFLDTSRTDMLKQSVYLISQRVGRVQLLEYHPPSPDGTGAKFVFPRVVDGKPMVEPGDKEVRFEWYVPVVDQKIYLNFKVSKMVYRGELNY